MTPPQAQPVSAERPLGSTAIAAASAAEGPFVINLRSSTTPMALSQPNDPALARFKFFMSRRLEDGRERFRLHMGFFETLAEAEEWLGVVREIYPGAWAGEAPGKRLKARTPDAPSPSNAGSTSAAATPAAAEARPTPASAAAPARAEPPIPHNVPVLQPASPVALQAVAPPVAIARPSAVPTDARRAAAPAARQAAVRPSRPAAGQPQPVASGKAAPSAPKIPTSAKQKSGAVRLPLSNVREVLAALDETGATRQMPALTAGKAGSAPAPAARASGAPAPAAASAQGLSPSPAAVPRAAAQGEPEQGLSDTQVLKLLESRRADGGAAEVDGGISLLKPDDTGTRRALKEAIATNAPVSFAVQLQWSVQSIDISKVPPLAIFSAYTLYTVEGSREGRRWYGLRLGFFSDAISAKQVAHYVRSEFNSVAVVPVSPQERTRATEGNQGPIQGPKPARSPLRDRLPEPTAEFKLLDDDEPSRPARPAARASSAAASVSAPAEATSDASGSAPMGVAAAATAPSERASDPPHAPAKPKAGAAAPAAKRGPRTPAGRVRARDRRSPQTLEETLEILGADQLEIDQGGGQTLNDTGVRHLKVEVRKNSPFTRLLDRLSERARGR